MTPLAAGEELQVPGCYPYGVRAKGSERSRHMRGGLGSVAVWACSLGLARARQTASLWTCMVGLPSFLANMN